MDGLDRFEIREIFAERLFLRADEQFKTDEPLLYALCIFCFASEATISNKAAPMADDIAHTLNGLNELFNDFLASERLDPSGDIAKVFNQPIGEPMSGSELREKFAILVIPILEPDLTEKYPALCSITVTLFAAGARTTNGPEPCVFLLNL
jgi:hypothetical protein